MLLSKGVCHDIYASPMSLAFVARLSRQYGLAFFFNDCCDKLFIVTTSFHCLHLCLCSEKAMKYRDKVQLTLSHNCHDILYSFFLVFFRDNHFYVMKFFLCILRNSSNPLSRHIFECRDNILLSFSLFFVTTNLSRQTFFAFFT